MRIGTKAALMTLAAGAMIMSACNNSTTASTGASTAGSSTTSKPATTAKTGGGGGSGGNQGGGGGTQGGGGNQGGDGGGNQGGGSGGGGGGGGGQETITVDALVKQFEEAGAKAGLDADTTKCVTDAMRASAPSDVLTAQQALNIQEEAVQACAQMNQRIHEIIVGGPTTTF